MSGRFLSVTARRGQNDKAMVLVRIASIRAISDAPHDGAGASTLIHIGEPHPLRVQEKVGAIIEAIGAAPMQFDIVEPKEDE